MTPWTELPSHRAWLDAECRRLLSFGLTSGLPGGGAAYLDDDGLADPAHGLQTWITCRMVHVYSLGTLLGIPGCGPVADTALAGLTGPLRDLRHGGWYHARAADGSADADAGKSCYDHAFVMLAASSAALAGRPGGTELLAEATRVYVEKFWDDDAGLPVDTWDLAFTNRDDYRGLNATMHSVEAMLAVADAVDALTAGSATSTAWQGGGATWRERAARAVAFVADLAERHAGRLPEHFGPDWTPDLGLNRDQPDDRFKPYGATPGHGLEWARLILHLEAATGPDAGLVRTATTLFDRAVADAWAADGADGFVYTTDWDGEPVVRTRMHWVLAEGIGAAAALHARTGDERFAGWYARWWDYAERYLVDRRRGSWHHELDPDNRPAAKVWPGKPDLYHAFQATLIPRLPLAPSPAAALAATPHGTM
ncbi:AGE family epimerase/isomerase [Myceligenerans xiligouense]|uniref:Mannose/cellobiose epimerase-like protein (N-acyl-D-glucosamine 2-epimerase family) n=1 Tax=Myceligenerans xiligouense TaxID=253184 RepID=A0A3N4YRH4_9MICO|nr:AGE family epimerase/isomerase [Myceligenerans xiligouense]RPF22747.1 mannose/cellobiose epimerase-like protein (N-acyl-D-glucosamine 2-epimerase family) [Myceligenerans xiligouense]